SSSTHNTRIERLWVEVGRHFCRSWRAFFIRLERCHGLDRHNAAHLWLLHILFLDAINSDCRAFQEEWNAHPISGPDTRDMSPQDLRFVGQTEHGLYVDQDECDGIDLADLHAYYGTTPDAPMRRRTARTGAGHPPEEDSDSEDAETEGDEPGQDSTAADDIAASQETNIRHPGVPVPDSACPFDNAEHKDVFFAGLNAFREQGYVPAGYGARPEEQEGGFEEIEVIRFGRRSAKELEVALPETTWQPRLELWAQGLHVLNRIVYEDES
ncbi:hypothetical protein C8T65DRAFT_755398, partial [Cerioporus squamosus]